MCVTCPVTTALSYMTQLCAPVGMCWLPLSNVLVSHKFCAYSFLKMYTRITLHLFYFFTHLFLVVLGLHCCAQDFCSCGGWEILFIAVLGLLTGGFSCCGAQALGAQASVVTVMHGLSTLGSVAVVHSLSCSAACGILKTRDESMSAALLGQFLSTGPSGKS